MKYIYRAISCVFLLWILIVYCYNFETGNSAFWNQLCFNLLFGIPLSIFTSIISAWLYSEFSYRRKEQLALAFYKKFIGQYKEYKVIAERTPQEEWEQITIDLSGFNLKVDFQTRVYKPKDLRAELILPGTLDQKRHFELFYEQQSVNGFDEGYWGKYDIQLMDSGEVIGHKYHTPTKPGPDGKVQYIITRIKWVKSP